MDWHAPAFAAFTGLVGYLYAAEPTREFVSFRPCGYAAAELTPDSPYGEVFTVAPQFKRFDVRPGMVRSLSMVDTGQTDIICTILGVGSDYQAVLGTIDEVKAKLTQ